MMKTFYSVLVTVLFSSCLTLTKNPGREREERPVSVGFPGVIYHPSEGTGVGFITDLDELRNDELLIRSGKAGIDARTVNNDTNDPTVRKIHQEEIALDTFFMMFPSPTSSFFFGLGLSAIYGQYGYNEHSKSFALDSNTSPVEWTDTRVTASLPLGLSLRYEEHVSMLLGVGPEFHIKTFRRFNNTGEELNIDVAQRDKTLQSFDSYQKTLGVNFLWQVGYTF
jgi:hypothetical protein